MLMSIPNQSVHLFGLLLLVATDLLGQTSGCCSRFICAPSGADCAHNEQLCGSLVLSLRAPVLLRARREYLPPTGELGEKCGQRFLCWRQQQLAAHLTLTDLRCSLNRSNRPDRPIGSPNLSLTTDLMATSVCVCCNFAFVAQFRCATSQSSGRRHYIGALG